jgi:beta-lactamase class A
MAGIIDYSRFEEHYSFKKKRQSLQVIILLLLAIPLFILSAKIIQDSKKTAAEFITPLALGIMDKRLESINQSTNSEELEDIVQKELRNANGKYAIAIKNLRTEERYFFNEHEIFESASLYKLFVMAEAFDQIKNGELSPERVLSQEIPILNEKFGIATESAELKEGSITIRVGDALTKMITISDNYSALLLSEAIRISNISAYLGEKGFKESKMGTVGGSPITTASDILLFFEKLYNGDLAEENETQAMLTLLKNQQLNNKLPKYLPKDTEMAHKTGELGRLSHDAGIVYATENEYIIIVLSETSIPLEANEKMANISKAVHEYFTN